MAEMTMTRWTNSKNVNKLLDEVKAKQAPELEAPSPPPGLPLFIPFHLHQSCTNIQDFV